MKNIKWVISAKVDNALDLFPAFSEDVSQTIIEEVNAMWNHIDRRMDFHEDLHGEIHAQMS